MDIRPKRRKSKDNPYRLYSSSDTKKYIVSFKDGLDIKRYVDINADVFDEMNKFELKDKSQMNEYDKHIEHSKQSEASLSLRGIHKEIPLEEIVYKNILEDEIRKAICELPEIQKRRIILLFYKEKTLREIAKIEKCTFRAVKFSIDYGLEKIKKKIEKFL